MERRKALLVAAVVSLVLVAGSAAVAANSLIGGSRDNVGKLTAVTGAPLPTEVSVVLERPGSVLTSTPPAAAGAAATAAVGPPLAPAPAVSSGHEGSDDGHDDDQRADTQDHEREERDD